jgi:hypothetical protein
MTEQQNRDQQTTVVVGGVDTHGVPITPLSWIGSAASSPEPTTLEMRYL